MLHALLPLVVALSVGAPPHAVERPALRELLLEWTARPRPAGSHGERVVADSCARELEAAGWHVERREVELSLVVPTHQQLVARAGGEGTDLVFERHESYDPTAAPAWDLPPVYLGVGAADVRGPVLDAGAGAAADYERLAALRLELAGAIALVRSDRPPAELAAAAEAAGVAALLVAPGARPDLAPEPWPAGPGASARHLRRGTLDPGCGIPVAPVFAREADALAQRLRARRVRGADGGTTTVRVGPGPVEVRLAVESAARQVQGIELVATLGAGSGWTLEASSGAYVRDASRLLPVACLVEVGRGVGALVAGGRLAAEHAPALRLAPTFAHGGTSLRLDAGGAAPRLDAPDGARAAGWSAFVDAEAAGAWSLALGLDGASPVTLTAADGFLLVERFLDPGLARTDALARSLTFVAEARGRRADGRPLTPELVERTAPPPGERR